MSDAHSLGCRQDRPSILLIDDDARVRKTLGDILRLKGYHTVTAEDAVRGIAEAHRAFANVALIDLMLPDMSGIEVMERIKAASPLTEAIVLTGHASMETAIEAINKGAYSYLVKPYQIDDLLQHIRRAIESQQAHEEIVRLASFPRLSPNPVIEANPSGAVTYLNPAAERAFPELGATGSADPVLSGLPELFAALRQAEGKEIVREVTVADLVYEEHISYVSESNLVRIYGLDITQRKHAEALLAAQERQQAAVAELGTLALAGMDDQAVLERAVAMVAVTLGVEYGAILEPLAPANTLVLRAGTGWREEEVGCTLVGTGWESPGAGALQADAPSTPAPSGEAPPLSLRRLLHEHRVVSAVTVAIGAQERPFGILGAYTSRPREFTTDDGVFLQAVANVLAAALQRRRAEDALAQQAVALEAANQELEAFSYSVSHDLRAPLRSIDGFSQALLEDYADSLDAAGQDYLRRVRAAAVRMGELIEDLLNLSRITRSDMRTDTVDLSRLTRAIAAELQDTQPERQVECVIAEGLVAQGDPRLLRAVLENLLSNAWKFTGKRPQARIEFGAAQEDGKQAYFVRDNGAGFDMAYADKLFGVFQRLHTPIEFPGTGVGLATVQRIIRRHGGRVWAQGAVGEGATFYFTLDGNKGPP